MAADWLKLPYKKHCFHVIKEMWRECYVLRFNQLMPYETGSVITLTVTWLCLSRPSKPLIRPEVFARGWLWLFFISYGNMTMMIEWFQFVKSKKYGETKKQNWSRYPFGGFQSCAKFSYHLKPFIAACMQTDFYCIYCKRWKLVNNI